MCKPATCARSPNRRPLHRVAVAEVWCTGSPFGCLGPLLLGDSSRPPKLHEAVITFTVGTVLVVAVLVRRPIPLGRFFRLPTNNLDTSIGVMIGGSLVLHALVHVALAITLSTTRYLVTSRVINWATLTVGAL